ncbi:1-acyl-sn-glycerol-3-phosphate acyltransferase [Mastigocoleus sp. MO_188.B34]|uniref:lysophospholipid acyltransferase family protein n=1 Tax=Mastigocoleus sp. MO_188.B34 TaxID=3036635 RepID=UPI002603C051|nr:1-acyl-sn-glycerol-3-phosphate acyltransferase [Mastigocoleus sp. MO_188.B34]MDJ0692802.1 1-acyl-sn-glycerol-3-phosphate acyltransferase [Mastigocoleus sp. MO_188.B34]
MIDFYSLSHVPEQKPLRNNLSRINYNVSPWLSTIAYILGRNLLLPLFFRQVRITGKENLPRTGPIILAPTHRARWDSLLLPFAAGRCVTGRDLRFMVTMNECQGLQGWFVRKMGGFPVDTRRPSIASLRYSIELLVEGEILVIYPEGDIFRDGLIHPLKPGISRLALTAESSNPSLGIKIVPIAINYSQPYPSWGDDASINIGKPIQVKDFIGNCIKKDAKLLTAKLLSKLQQLDERQSEINSSPFAEIPNS